MNKYELKRDYSDIINLEHHISNKHSRMSIQNRAFQFAPFAALTGYSDAIDETARTTDEMLIIDDNLKYIIDQKLNYIKLNIQKNIYVKIIYFVKDLKKSGGKYFISNGLVTKIDEYKKRILLDSGEKINIENIYDIQFENEY